MNYDHHHHDVVAVVTVIAAVDNVVVSGFIIDDMIDIDVNCMCLLFWKNQEFLAQLGESYK
jgi:hypothetical protein